MRSKILNRILKNTPKEIKSSVESYSDQILRIEQLMKDKNNVVNDYLMSNCSNCNSESTRKVLLSGKWYCINNDCIKNKKSVHK